MKRAISILLAALLAAASAITAGASVPDYKEGTHYKSEYTKVNTERNICTYETPDAEKGGYGMAWYDDDREKGEHKLTDGVLPIEADLEAARVEKEFDENIYYGWEGWIALAKTKDAFVLNEKVNVDFGFERPITLKEVAVYSAALVKGSVGIPKGFRIYAANDDGVYYETELAYEEGSGEFGVYKQDLAVLTLETPVVTKRVRLVMDCGYAAWVFLSEVEFFEQKDAETAVDIEILVKRQEGEKEAEESGDTEESGNAESNAEESSQESESSAIESSAAPESSVKPAESSVKPAESSRSAVSAPGFSVSDDGGDGISGGTIALIAGIAVVVIAAAIVLLCRRKKK